MHGSGEQLALLAGTQEKVGHQTRCTNIYEMKHSAANASGNTRRNVQLVGRENAGGGWLNGHRAKNNAVERAYFPLASAARCAHGATNDEG